MELEPYLFFYGKCEEALNFYKGVFGGEITRLSRNGEAPPDAQMPPDVDKNGVMHANFESPSVKFMASDGRGQPATQSYISLSLGTNDRAEAKRIFDKLSEGGKVEMPMSDVFWGGQFGMCTDKYSIDWMVSAE